jgi:hypothetical protein
MSEHENKQNPELSESAPNPLGFGKENASPEVVAKAKGIALEAARQIQAAVRQPIERRDALRIVSAFRSTLIPRRRPGRKQRAVITAALADYKSGIRGVALYREHIPRFASMSHWEREVKARRLMDAIRSRERRARAN